ncbi:MAG: KEOPS complex kinase/ATPase Bud32 [archaeon]
MTQKIIAQGAEAKIILSKGIITKDRITKSYRIPKLDKTIRKRRTRSEAKLLTKASQNINCPFPIEIQEHKLILPYIKGKKLSEHLDELPIKKQKQILKQIGTDIAKLHDQDIIHGDLTTSNIILFENKIYLIDFGLGYFNGKHEDKAVDIHLLKQALVAKHFRHAEELFKEVLKGYKKSKNSKIVLERLKAVEKRGRYKG